MMLHAGQIFIHVGMWDWVGLDVCTVYDIMEDCGVAYSDVPLLKVSAGYRRWTVRWMVQQL